MIHSIFHVPKNVALSNNRGHMFVYGVTGAVIKMIIIGRTPNMRHRVNMDPTLSTRHVTAKEQIVDILTLGSLTPSQWTDFF